MLSMDLANNLSLDSLTFLELLPKDSGNGQCSLVSSWSDVVQAASAQAGIAVIM